jgi:hypothetical protein
MKATGGYDAPDVNRWPDDEFQRVRCPVRIARAGWGRHHRK